MQHLIDPTNDYAFKQLFGLPENADLLLHFLNSLLNLPVPIAEVQHLNPISLSETAVDKSHVLDVKARDQLGRSFQVEIQVRVLPGLPARMLHTWAELYQSQIEAGQDYTALQPVISVWILDDDLLTEPDATDHWHHHFQLYDPERRLQLSDHVAIHTVELRKWRRPRGGGLARQEEWVYFLKEARSWSALPVEITTRELRKAMAVLERISQKELDYWRYKDQERAAREQRTLENLFKAEQEKVKAEQEKVKAEQEKVRMAEDRAEAALEQVQTMEQALAALQDRLRALGMDPNLP